MADAAADSAGETITLRVKDQTGDEMFFKVKKNTRMQVHTKTIYSSYFSMSIFITVGIAIFNDYS
jgi:hypothetical protein